MKDYRVVQISFDVVIDNNVDGMKIADKMAEDLETVGYEVLGAGFQADVTEYYKD